MFKKFLLSMLAMCLLVVQANAATHNNLKEAFDELHYTLTVEWDQKDKAFYNAQMDKFSQAVRELQQQGMTNQELIEFTLTQVKDQQLAKDLRTAFSMVMINRMGPEEAHKYVTEVMSHSYGQGANWAGGVILGAIGLVIFIALAAIVAGKAKVEDGCYKIYTCKDHCFGNACYTECDYRCI